MLLNRHAWHLLEKPQTNTAPSLGCVARVVCLKSRFIASPTMRGKQIIVMSLAWGLNGAVFQFSERTCAQSQALGQITSGWIASGRLSVLQGAIFWYHLCSPERNFTPGSHSNSTHPGSHRLRRTIEQLRTVVISSFVPKGYIYLGFYLFIF